MLGDAEAALALGGTSPVLCWLLAVLSLAPAGLACIGEIVIVPQNTYNISEVFISGIFVNANSPFSAAVSLAPGLSAAADLSF